MSTTLLSAKTRTFRPKKIDVEGTKGYQLRRFAEATLGSGSLREAVKLPEGEDEDEWLASNAVDFYNQINMLYTAITEFCTRAECPIMKAGDAYEYLWQDNDDPSFRRPTEMSAPEYIDHLLAWVRRHIDNDDIFPCKIGVAFPANFRTLVGQIARRLFRVYAHMYCHHFRIVVALGEEAHLNTSFKHFVLWAREFGLIEEKEYAPVAELIDGMLASDA